MPLYEDRRNAENKIIVNTSCRDAITMDTASTVQMLLDAIKKSAKEKGRPPVVALDGWYGVEWQAIILALRTGDTDHLIGDYRSATGLYQNQASIRTYKTKFLTEDPGFGWVNDEGHLSDLMDAGVLSAWRRELSTSRERATVLVGYGAAVPELTDVIDITVYFDKTRQPVLWQMWEGLLTPLGCESPDSSYGWKEYYYCDYHLLDRQKKYLSERIHFWVEAISPDCLKGVPRAAYDEIIQTLLKYPVKEIKIYQPGPWGAYRYRDLFDVPGLECNAWNELAGPELGMVIELSEDIRLEMPMLNLMQHQRAFLGAHLTENYPGLFPLDVWLDDGYFPDKLPLERTAMPIHNHPSTGYVKRHFNEPLGRYETYYICEAYEGACTIMGYKDDVDLEKWENIARESENRTIIPDWREYVEIWDSNVGDLYLIPPGTTHGHGGNQMVLEMDTCPSVAATEYSFFSYDFARNSWDDSTKTMTGKPLRMHTEHAFDNEKWRRGSWVKDHLLVKPKVQKWTKSYKFDRYASLPEMPFEVERFHFENKAEGTTTGIDGMGAVRILTLTIGRRAIIQSRTEPERRTEIERFQSAILPAEFGDFDVISMDGGFCEVVQFRWKDVT